MKKKLTAFYIFLSLLGVVAAIGIFILGFAALQKADSTQEHVEQTLEQAETEMDQLTTQKEALEKQQQTEEQQQIAEEAAQKAAQEKANGEADLSSEESTDKSSVFDGNESVTQTASNGHIVCIDPGHQGEWVDMSATEPNGPGSSVMKAKCSTGTSGTYTGLNEYQLNLDVSLKLQQILTDRGYQVVMTRTDNDTAISNAERAQLATSSGAEITVRVHANGDDSHTASGALTMCPSSSNPYVSNLYDQSNLLSQCILDSYCAATGFSSRGIIYTDDMTGINWSTIPVTIVEMGFMTYESDDLQMADPDFQQTMATGIADGIDAYFSQVS